jgi:uncharacterized membrane protein YedE/YeeE
MAISQALAVFWATPFADGPACGAMRLAGVPTVIPTHQTGLIGLAIAGLFVGFGTRLSNGCTSGHGVCGLSNLSPRSLVATLTFMAIAAATVFVVRHGQVFAWGI